MTHGVLGVDERALVHHVEVAGSLLNLEVAQLHGAKGISGEAHGHGFGEVARVVVLLAVLGRNYGARDVVGFHDADVGDLEDFAVGVNPCAAPQSLCTSVRLSLPP